MDLKIKKAKLRLVTMWKSRGNPQVVNHADRYKIETDKYGQEVLISGKQINGYVVVVETISTKKNELKLKTLYRENGKLENNPIFRDSGLSSQLPPKGSEGSLNPQPSANLDAPPQTAKTDSSTTPLNLEAIPAKATELFNTAKEQEAGFRGLLESIPGQHSLEAGNLLKSVESIESKIRRKQGDITAIGDFLRAAIVVEHKGQLNNQLMRIEDSLRAQGINPTIELHHRQSGYKGVHIQFNYNGVASEIQLHTANNWGIKKGLDPMYHVLRDPNIRASMPYQRILELEAESNRLAQGFDLDISDLASYEVSLTSASNSEKSVLVRKLPDDLKPTQEPLEKSNSKPLSSDPETAYNRPESELSRNSNFSGDSGKSIQTPLNNPTKPPLKTLHIEPNPAFGEHFKEFEGKGKEAVAKLLQERRGQVAGAFYREDLGYIDLVWGVNATDLKGLRGANGKPIKPYGLSKILEKHASDFESFKGADIQEKLAKGITKIIEKGYVPENAGIYTIRFKNQDGSFRESRFI